MLSKSALYGSRGAIVQRTSKRAYATQKPKPKGSMSRSRKWGDDIFSRDTGSRVKNSLASGGRSSTTGLITTIFGNTGFLGRSLSARLGRVGTQVVLPFRGEETKIRDYKVMGDLGQIVPVRWDIRHYDSILNAVKHSEVVITAVDRQYPTKSFTYEEVLVNGPYLIAKACAEMGVKRLVHVSHICASHDSPSEYYRLKKQGEDAVLAAFPQATIIKACDLFGDGDTLLNNMGSMMAKWPLFMLTEPERLYQPLWVNDLAEAVVRSIDMPSAAGKTYHVGGPVVYREADLVHYVRKETGHYNRRISVIPWPIMYMMAKVQEKVFVLHPWQRRLNSSPLKETSDRIVPDEALSCKDLGMTQKSLLRVEESAVDYLRRYRSEALLDELSQEQEAGRYYTPPEGPWPLV